MRDLNAIWVTTLKNTNNNHTLNITVKKSSSGQGRLPAHISNTTHPTLHMSTLELYPFPFWLPITSGAIQNTVPCIAVYAAWSSSARFEIPKSEILQMPVFSTRILSDLRSWGRNQNDVINCEGSGTLWMMFLECRYAKPSRIWAVKDFVTSSSNLPWSRRQLPTEPPGTYSKKLRHL